MLASFNTGLLDTVYNLLRSNIFQGTHSFICNSFVSCLSEFAVGGGTAAELNISCRDYTNSAVETTNEDGLAAEASWSS